MGISSLLILSQFIYCTVTKLRLQSPREAGRQSGTEASLLWLLQAGSINTTKAQGSTQLLSSLGQLLGSACITAVALQLFLCSSYITICASQCILKWTPAGAQTTLWGTEGELNKFSSIYCSQQFKKPKAEFPLCGTFRLMAFPLVAVFILLLFEHLPLNIPNSSTILWLTQLNLNFREELRHTQPKEWAWSHGYQSPHNLSELLFVCSL